MNIGHGTRHPFLYIILDEKNIFLIKKALKKELSFDSLLPFTITIKNIKKLWSGYIPYFNVF